MRILTFVSTIDEISSGVKFFVSHLYSTWIFGFVASLTTVKGQCLRSR